MEKDYTSTRRTPRHSWEKKVHWEKKCKKTIHTHAVRLAIPGKKKFIGKKKVKKNIKIDWSVREGTRAELRVLVRNLLDKYGYPPDFSKLAVDLVIRQAESLTEEWLQDSIIG